jgi:hypothetical protein
MEYGAFRHSIGILSVEVVLILTSSGSEHPTGYTSDAVSTQISGLGVAVCFDSRVLR